MSRLGSVILPCLVADTKEVITFGCDNVVEEKQEFSRDAEHDTQQH